MRKLAVLLVGASVVLPVFAQETPAEETAPAADSAAPVSDPSATPAEADAPAAEQPADAPTADAATPPADSASAPADAPAADATASPSGDASAPVDAAAPSDGTTAASPDAAASDAQSSADAAAPAEPAADSSGAVAESGASSDGSAASGEGERKPWAFYAGYDYAHLNFLISDPAPQSSPNPPAMQTQFGGDSFASNFHQIRFGMRVFDVIGIEAHVGQKADDGAKAGTVAVKDAVGIYVVPTGTVLETLEVSALVGYSKMTLERPGASADLKGVSYGVNAELPLRVLSESLPDIRLGGGFMVYHQDTESRTYGTHFGVRYDFKI